MQIDHVIMAVDDLDRAAADLKREHGLASTVGGEHPGYGTGNRIVSLGGNQYLELMGVVDADLADQNPLGRRVRAVAPGWLGWCVAVGDIAGVATQLGLPALPMSRRRPDGTTIGWRLAGLDAALREPWLPFFIQWDEPQGHPGSGTQPDGATRSISSLTVEGDLEQIDEWVAGAALPVQVKAGSRGITAVDIDGPEGTLTLTM